MDKEKELLQKYQEVYNQEQHLQEQKKAIVEELKLLDEHKVGEIVRWTEKNRRKRIGGTVWHPEYEAQPDKKRSAVLTDINITIYLHGEQPSIRKGYEFHPIKIDGGISMNQTFPDDGFVWTGEIHKDFINRYK